MWDTWVVGLNILCLNLNCYSQQHVSAPEMVVLRNLYRPLKYHREQIKSSKTKYPLESEWKNAEILCNHVSQCTCVDPNLWLFRLNSEWGKSWNCGCTGNRNNVRNDAGKELLDIFTDRNCNVYQHIWGTQRRFPPKYFENFLKAIQSTFRSLFYKGFSIIFPKILDAI